MIIKRAWRNFINPITWIFPIPILNPFIKRLSLTAEVKNGKLKVERGLLGKDISEIQIDHITDIQVNKSVIQRLLVLGDLGIATSGTAGHEVVIDGIGSPMKVKENILKAN